MLEPRPEIRTATRFLVMRSPVKTEAFRDRRYRHRHRPLGRAKLRFVRIYGPIANIAIGAGLGKGEI
jgi:hypothetical protein